MEHVNGRIIVATVVLMGAGVYRVLVVNKPATGNTSDPNAKRSVTITRVLVGGYMLAVVASIIDLVGGPASTIAGLLMGLAVMTALYAVLPDLFQRFAARRANPGGGGGGGGASGFSA